MPIPDFQSIMLPLLKFARDKKEHSIREAIDHITRLFQLTDEEKKRLLEKYKLHLQAELKWIEEELAREK